MSDADLVQIMGRTLIGNRFVLDAVDRKPHYMVFKCHRFDEFGVSMPYEFVLCGKSPLGQPAAKAIAREAATHGFHAVAICDESCAPLPSIPWATFIDRCGGPIRSWLPLEPTFPAHLEALGHNKLPPDVTGKADDLFEEYVQLGLQFLLADRVIRYGQDRRYEARPDGLALTRDQLVLPYDAKAYGKGYEVTHDSIRQFAEYVADFEKRYTHYIGRPYAFLLVSGHFVNGEESLIEQSNSLVAECGVRLVYLTATDLGAAITLLSKQPTLRPSINWRKVFAATTVTAARVSAAAEATQKDRIITT